MSWTRNKATGRGVTRLRLEIEGLPYEFVTAKDMQQLLSDGRRRVNGLNGSDISWSYTGNFLEGKIEGDGFNAKIVDVDKNRWATKAFGRKRQALCYLLTNMDAFATMTVNVRGTTDNFPATGIIHIDGEALSYNAKTSGSFSINGRGVWGSRAQAHYTTVGENSFYTSISDTPASIEGRTCKLFAYGPGDDPQGDGSQVFVGMVRIDPTFSPDEGWTIGIDPVTSFLEQSWGGPSVSPVQIRGIYYPYTMPFNWLVCYQVSSTVQTERRCQVKGFFETEADFAAVVELETKAAMAALGISTTIQDYLSVRPMPQGGIEFIFNVATACNQVGLIFEMVRGNTTMFGAQSVRLHESLDSPSYDRCDWYIYSGDGRGNGGQFSFGGPSATMPAREYRRRVYAPFPRAYVGNLVRRNGVGPYDANNPSTRIYFNGAGLLDDGSSVVFDMANEDAYENAPKGATISSSDTDYNFFDIGNDGTWTTNFLALSLADDIQISGRSTNVTLSSVWQNLDSARASGVTLGVTPDLTVDTHVALPDSNGWGWYDNVLPTIAEGRTYYQSHSEKQSLMDVLAPELLAYGYIWTVTGGMLSVRPLRMATKGLTAQHTITDRDITSQPVLERTAWGQLNEVVYECGYEPGEKEWKGTTFRFRNELAIGANGKGRAVNIKRFFTIGAGDDIGTEEMVTIGQKWLAHFGRGYEVFSFTTTLRKFDIKIGDTVRISASRLPNTRGTLGVTDRLGVVLGVSYSPAKGEVGLQVLMSDREFPGIAPSFRIDSQVNTSGFNWTLTVDLSDMGTYDPTDLLATGDLLRIEKWDSATPGTINCTVTSVTATEVLVTTASTWTPGSDSWLIRPRAATSYSSTSNIGSRYGFVSSSTDATLSLTDGPFDPATYT